MAVINREYKDRLFKFIFGNEKNKAWALSLYNAINGTNYTNKDDLELTTIDDSIYMGMKNDVSFLISNRMNLYEQQSTYNPNMPLRFLLYAGDVYSAYLKKNKQSIYSPYLQKIPAPVCVCLYNGRNDAPEREELSLSDAFINNEKGSIEIKVLMLNINFNKNRKLLEDSKPLYEYSWFVAEVRKNQDEGMSLHEAINAALRVMPDDYLIKPFLMKNKAEVEKMCIKEYDEEETFNIIKAECESRGRAEGRAEGITEGKTEGVIETLVGFLKDGLISETKAADRAGMSLENFRKAAAVYCN